MLVGLHDDFGRMNSCSGNLKSCQRRLACLGPVDILDFHTLEAGYVRRMGAVAGVVDDRSFVERTPGGNGHLVRRATHSAVQNSAALGASYVGQAVVE